MPAHTHVLRANADSPSVDDPTDRVLASAQIYSTAQPDVTLNAASIGEAGAGQPFSNMQPYLALNAIICLLPSGCDANLTE